MKFVAGQPNELSMNFQIVHGGSCWLVNSQTVLPQSNVH